MDAWLKKRSARSFVSGTADMMKGLVKPLAGLLGVVAEDAVFLDVERLKPGQLWEKEITEAVERSSVFVVCWCCETERSRFVMQEIALALRDP